jgi:O-methyltransferase domain
MSDPERPPLSPPRLAVRAALALRRRLRALADAVVTPQLALFEQGMGLARTQLLHAAARLRVADLLADGPLEAADLARATGADPDVLRRVLRALAAGGVFALREDGRFENNRLSGALRSDARASMRAFLEYVGSAPNVAAWGDIDRTIATGKNAFERVHGMTVWEWFARHREEGRTFAEAMAGITEIDAPAVAAGYPFGGLERLCDVAGGRGTLLAEILRRHPRLRGVLVEAPEVIAEAPPFLAARGVGARVECVGGSIFDAIPAGCDAYLLKDVLHDWDDAAALRILQACRRAAGPGARVLVAEILVERLDTEYPGALVDVHMMMVCQEGRQRSAAEHHALMAEAGFRPGRVVTLAGPLGLVEGIAP